MNVDPVLLWIVQVATGCLFLTSVLHKLGDWGGFRDTLSAYDVVPPRLLRIASIALVALEVLTGAGAVLGVDAAFVLAAALLGGYAAVMASSLMQGRHLLDCGCGGARQPVSWWLFARNVVLAVFVLLGTATPASRVLGVLDYASIAGGVAMLALIYAAANELLASQARLEEWV